MAMLLQRGTLEQPTFSAGRSNRAVYGILKPCSRQFAVSVEAAKKGDKKGGKQSSLAGLLAEKQKKLDEQVAQQYRTPEVRGLLLLIANSYYKLTGKILIEADFERLPDAIFNAPFVLLAHDKFQAGVTDPRFTYANRNALELFEASWQELIGLPSRKSAAEVADIQQERQQLLAQAANTGVITDYAGWRQGLKGRVFKIKGVTLFNVMDGDGEAIGQAALFDRYELQNGQEVIVQGHEDPNAASSAEDQAAASGPPSQEEIDAAEAAVKQWGDYIRAMKEQGLNNKSPEVVAAVGSLNAWKTQLASLKERLEKELEAARAAFPDDNEDE